MTYQLSPDSLEQECDRMIATLGDDHVTEKQTDDSVVSYHFIFSPDYESVSCHISLAENLCRLEFIVGQAEEGRIGKVLLDIAQDMDLHRPFPIRVIVRAKENNCFQILLECVCEPGVIQIGFIGTIMIVGIELAQSYREFLQGQKEAA